MCTPARAAGVQTVQALNHRTYACFRERYFVFSTLWIAGLVRGALGRALLSSCNICISPVIIPWAKHKTTLHNHAMRGAGHGKQSPQMFLGREKICSCTSGLGTTGRYPSPEQKQVLRFRNIPCPSIVRFIVHSHTSVCADCDPQSAWLMWQTAIMDRAHVCRQCENNQPHSVISLLRQRTLCPSLSVSTSTPSQSKKSACGQSMFSTLHEILLRAASGDLKGCVTFN